MIIRIFDNGGETIDRYTIVDIGRKLGPNSYQALALCATGASVSMFVEVDQNYVDNAVADGEKELQLTDLPEKLQKHITKRMETEQ